MGAARGGGGAARSEADSKWWTLGTMRKWEGGPGEEEEETQPAQNFGAAASPSRSQAQQEKHLRSIAPASKASEVDSQVQGPTTCLLFNSESSGK